MNKPQTDLTEQDIVSWFKANPKAWQDMPELRAVIENPEPGIHGDGATSLADFQLRRLRQENAKLQAQLRSLLSVAQTNEQLMRRLHSMGLAWASITSSNEFIEQFQNRLRTEFGADSVCLHLTALPKSLTGREDIRAFDTQALEWLDGSASKQAQCGRFTQAKLSQLFPDAEAKIQSAAVVALDAAGWLAIGSEDESKFQPDMGTVFLELLAETVSHRLAQMSDAT
ncbi:MAG TPA: DUF484 family protein [Wenzhouxiangella sp.]